MSSPDYLPLALQLPHMYQEDAESFAQIDSYLGLADDLYRAVVDRLDEAGHWLSPLAPDLWPPTVPLTGGDDALLASYEGLFDELAAWMAFRFPRSWASDAGGLSKRRAFLLNAARIWRRRGTPRGFLEWFAFAFDITADERPYLIEHYKVAMPGSMPLDPGLRATLFVPSTAQFSDFVRRREAIAFTDRYAPAHVHVRVCWTRPDFTLDPVPAPGASIAVQDAYRTRVRELLCSLVSFIDHANGVRIWECVDEGRSIDRLGVGRLPGGG